MCKNTEKFQDYSDKHRYLIFFNQILSLFLQNSLYSRRPVLIIIRKYASTVALGEGTGRTEQHAY